MSIKTILLFSIISLIAHYGNAQSDYYWHRCDELNPVRSYGRGLYVDSSGFFLLYNDMTDTNSQYTECNLAKYDLSANLLWTNNFMASPNGSPALSNLVFTTDSHFVFCGRTNDNPAKGFYSKTDYLGNLVFLNNYGNQYYYKFTRAIELSNGELLFLGHTDSLASSSGLRNLFLLKTDSMGNEIWNKCVTLNTMIEGAIGVDKYNDNIYVTTSQTQSTTSSSHFYSKLICITDGGQIVYSNSYLIGAQGGSFVTITCTNRGTLMLGGDLHEYYWPNDGTLLGDQSYGLACLAEYDTLGSEIWSKKYFVPSFLNGIFSIKEVSGGYLLGGYTGWSFFYLPDSLYSAPSYSIDDLFLMKTDEYGDSIWMRLYRKQDGSQAYSNVWANQEIPEQLQIAENGDIYYTGWFLPMMTIPGNWKQYAWVMKTDSNGCGKPGTPYGLWREELPYNQDSSIVHLTWLDDDTTNVWHHVQGSKDGQYYFWELTPRPVTNKEFFDTVPKYHTYCYRVFGLDSTWARTCESAEICITTGIEEYGPETGLLSFYPNPATVIINCVLPDNEDYEIIIYNALSSNVTSSGVEKVFGNGVCTLNISRLPPGIYYIEARGEKVLRGRFVKE